ncbi:MAG: 3-ketoacyl-ACP reductase [Lautropia sp.]
MQSSRPLAVVTGAGRGIGACIAVELAGAGYDIAITDRATSGFAPTRAAIEATGARARCIEADLADVEGHAALVREVVAWGGPIATLVNNAGVGSPRRGDLLDVTPAAFDTVLDVNLRGTFFLTQEVARHMVVTSGLAGRSIVTVSSVSAEMASVDRGEYCVSKSGLAMLTRLFALRLAGEGIGVFEVRPGVIRTPMTEPVSARYDQRIADGLVPMQRWGRPDDVARVVRALAAGQMGFATGSVIDIDGGLSIPRL